MTDGLQWCRYCCSDSDTGMAVTQLSKYVSVLRPVSRYRTHLEPTEWPVVILVTVPNFSFCFVPVNPPKQQQHKQKSHRQNNKTKTKQPANQTNSQILGTQALIFFSSASGHMFCRPKLSFWKQSWDHWAFWLLSWPSPVLSPDLALRLQHLCQILRQRVFFFHLIHTKPLSQPCVICEVCAFESAMCDLWSVCLWVSHVWSVKCVSLSQPCVICEVCAFKSAMCGLWSMCLQVSHVWSVKRVPSSQPCVVCEACAFKSAMCGM